MQKLTLLNRLYMHSIRDINNVFNFEISALYPSINGLRIFLLFKKKITLGNIE